MFHYFSEAEFVTIIYYFYKTSHIMKNNLYAFHTIKLTMENIYICLARNFGKQT